MSSNRNYLQHQVIWLGLLDAICLLIGVVAGVMIRLGPDSLNEYVFSTLSRWFYLFMAVLVSNYVTGTYGLELRFSRFNMVVSWLFSMVMAVLVVGLTSYAWFDNILGRGVLFLALGFYSGLWLTLRMVAYNWFFRTDAMAYRVAILGSGSRAKQDLALVQNPHLCPKHKVVALIHIEDAKFPNSDLRLPIAEFPNSDLRLKIEEIDIHQSKICILHCLPSQVAATVRSLACDVLMVAVDREEEIAGVYAQLRRLRFEGVSVLGPLNVAEVYGGRVPLNLVDEHWLMTASMGFISPMTMRFKRVIDIVLVLLSVPIALYLGGLVALIIKLSNPRAPVFYSQERVGRFGRIFRIHKFRTMTVGAEQGREAAWSPDNDPRITWAGKSLRKYRLDELPQLWDVLMGEMSLVGPRPERPELVEKLAKVIPYYRERENIPPGLTGWAQIRYPYGATIEDARMKLEFDLYYLQNLSVALDLRIILRTLRIVLFGMEREIR